MNWSLLLFYYVVHTLSYHISTFMFLILCFLKRESAKNRKVKKNLTAPQWPLAKLTGAKYILVGAIPHTHTLSLCLCLSLSLSLSLSLILPLKTKETQYLKLKDIDLRRLSLVLQSFNSLSISLPKPLQFPLSLQLIL